MSILPATRRVIWIVLPQSPDKYFEGLHFGAETIEPKCQIKENTGEMTTSDYQSKFHMWNSLICSLNSEEFLCFKSSLSCTIPGSIS